MARSVTKMRGGNKGLTVRVNLFALEKYRADFDAESARLWMKGSVTHADTKEQKMFNDGGELLTILGKWNSRKFQDGK